jgi:hypothetical protein
MMPDLTIEDLLLLIGDKEATIYRLKKMILAQEKEINELKAPKSGENDVNLSS